MSNMQIQAMMRSPKKLMHFHATGELPRECAAPSTPLLKLISSIPMRQWHQYTGVTVDRRLGFNGSRQFDSLHQVATWIGRNARLVDNKRMPYMSWMITGFNKKLQLEDLQAKCSKYPL